MGRLSLKEKQINLKREHIIEIAKDLFFDKGYVETAIEEVASEAGMSKSTFYTYIKSKEELFMHIHLEGMQQRLELLSHVMNEKKTGYDKVYAFGLEYYRFYRNNPGYFKLHAYEDYNTLDKERVGIELYARFDELLSQIIRLVKEAFILGEQDGTIKNEIDPGYLDKYLAYTLRAIINVAFHPEKTKHIKENFDQDSFYHQYLDLFMSAIKK